MRSVGSRSPALWQWRFPWGLGLSVRSLRPSKFPEEFRRDAIELVSASPQRAVAGTGGYCVSTSATNASRIRVAKRAASSGDQASTPFSAINAWNC